MNLVWKISQLNYCKSSLSAKEICFTSDFLFYFFCIILKQGKIEEYNGIQKQKRFFTFKVSATSTTLVHRISLRLWKKLPAFRTFNYPNFGNHLTRHIPSNIYLINYSPNVESWPQILQVNRCQSQIANSENKALPIYFHCLHIKRLKRISIRQLLG